jgi:hypothetical protein
MKKKSIYFAAIMLITTIALYGCKKDDENETTTTTINSSEMSESVEVKTSIIDDDQSLENDTREIPSSVDDDFDSPGGGNPEKAEKEKVLEITVSEDKYFVDNHEVSFDEFVEKVQALGEESYVRLYDEKSTLKAFKKVKDYLEENKIYYELGE